MATPHVEMHNDTIIVYLYVCLSVSLRDNWFVVILNLPGPNCSKLKMSLVNVQMYR